MAKLVKVKPTLNDAGSVKIVWEKNPDFKLGNIGFSDFIALYEATNALDKDHTIKDVELSGIRDSRDNKARDLRSVVTRFRSAARGCYGPDSAEYGQAGGTRDSARRSPNRKAKAETPPQA